MDSTLHLPTILMLAVMVAGASAFVVGAMLWLRRLRQHLGATVGEALTRQIQHGAKVEEALAVLQRNHKQLEAQVQTLAQAHARARADINILTQKLERSESAPEAANSQGRVLH